MTAAATTAAAAPAAARAPAGRGSMRVWSVPAGGRPGVDAALAVALPTSEPQDGQKTAPAANWAPQDEHCCVSSAPQPAQ
jgi:hypothetical protein